MCCEDAIVINRRPRRARVQGGFFVANYRDSIKKKLRYGVNTRVLLRPRIETLHGTSNESSSGRDQSFRTENDLYSAAFFFFFFVLVAF